MSSTYTTSSTYTITHARQVTSKIAADLRQLKLFYGRPSDDDVAAYAEEAAILLRDGYLERVDFGFKRTDAMRGQEWVLLLRYKVTSGTLNDDHSGRVPPGLDLTGTAFSSFLTYSSSFHQLSATERSRVKESLPVQRSSGDDAGFATGTWGGDRSYSSHGRGVGRSVFSAT